jgi:hypothetical protein
MIIRLLLLTRKEELADAQNLNDSDDDECAVSRAMKEDIPTLGETLVATVAKSIASIL